MPLRSRTRYPGSQAETNQLPKELTEQGPIIMAASTVTAGRAAVPCRTACSDQGMDMTSLQTMVLLGGVSSSRARLASFLTAAPWVLRTISLGYMRAAAHP